MTKRTSLRSQIADLSKRLEESDFQLRGYREKWPAMARSIEEEKERATSYQRKIEQAQSHARECLEKVHLGEAYVTKLEAEKTSLELDLRRVSDDFQKRTALLGNLYQQIEAREKAIVAVSIGLAESRFKTTWGGA